MRAVQREEEVWVLPRQAADEHQLATDGDLSREHAEVVALEDDPRSADLLDALDENPGDVLVLYARDGDGVGLDDAALLLAMVTTSSPSRCVWSRSTGVMTATCASMTLVASHEPPRPTSMIATSTGASANAA